MSILKTTISAILLTPMVLFAILKLTLRLMPPEWQFPSR